MITFAFKNKICSGTRFNFIIASTLALYSPYKIIHFFHLQIKYRHQTIQSFAQIKMAITTLPSSR